MNDEFQVIQIDDKNGMKIKHKNIQNKQIKSPTLQFEFYYSQLTLKQINFFIENFIEGSSDTKTLKKILQLSTIQQLKGGNTGFSDLEDELQDIQENYIKQQKLQNYKQLFQKTFGDYIILPELIFRSCMLYKLNKLCKKNKFIKFQYGVYGNVINFTCQSSKTNFQKMNITIFKYIFSKELFNYLYTVSDKVLYIMELPSNERQIFKQLIYQSLNNMYITLFCDNIITKSYNTLLNTIRKQMYNLHNELYLNMLPFLSIYFETNGTKYIDTSQMKRIRIKEYFFDNDITDTTQPKQYENSENDHIILRLEKHILNILYVYLTQFLDIECLVYHQGLFVDNRIFMTQIQYRKLMQQIEQHLMVTPQKNIQLIVESTIYSEYKIDLIQYLSKIEKKYIILFVKQLQKIIENNFKR